VYELRSRPPEVRSSLMDRHSKIVSDAIAEARASGGTIVGEVIRLQLALIAARAGANLRLRQFVELARTAHASGDEAEMVRARVAMWDEIERIEGNSVSITYRDSALLRGLLPFPEPDDTNDDGLAWTSEMIEAADRLPAYPEVDSDC
jgi:hypothetical protein